MVVYGTEEYGRQKLKDDLESNPAWASFRAVKEKRMVFLPSDFVNSPGLKIDQTFEYLAKLVYPDAYEKNDIGVSDMEDKRMSVCLKCCFHVTHYNASGHNKR
ncbi:hypothetical protein B5G50_17550 [Brevibacillus brevis]|uniref:ABC transporter substrate-binding protein n=1 Tax=Brevibacillus brevis TaxID=1393 RepID=UPI000B38D901|nr:ABC transporter substrate-binding protein [Brevibacillus brevis]OUQ87029.1 hypothetical protein B5G50_17550 [Brevibacillus brevis]